MTRDKAFRDETLENARRQVERGTATASDNLCLDLHDENTRLGQLLAHVHLHLTNDEDFDPDELERDIRNAGGGQWVDTESKLLELRTALRGARESAGRTVMASQTAASAAGSTVEQIERALKSEDAS